MIVRIYNMNYYITFNTTKVRRRIYIILCC